MKGTLNNEIVKYGLMIVTTPFWWPFLRALWQELNDSLRDEGGLLGTTPSRDKLREIDRDLGRFESPLVSEPREDARTPARRTPSARRERSGFEAGPRGSRRSFR